MLWIAKLGLGRLPRDSAIEGEHVRFAFAIATGLPIGIVPTLILRLFRRREPRVVRA